MWTMNLMVAAKGCFYERSRSLMPMMPLRRRIPRVILLDPAGRTFDQAYAEELAQEEELIFYLWSL